MDCRKSLYRRDGRLIFSKISLNVLPLFIGNSNAINILLTTNLFLLLFLLVCLYVADVLDVGETQYYHQVVDKLNFHTVVEQDRWVFNLFWQSVFVGFYDAFGQSVKKLQETVIDGQDQVWGFSGNVLGVRVSSGDHVLDAFFALVGKKWFFCVEPFSFEVFVQLAHFST